MSHQYGDPYDDSYNRSSQYGYNTNQHQQSAQHAQYNNTQDSYQTNPYGDEPRYPSYPTDPSVNEYHANASTEKVLDDGSYPTNTERAQRGRQGLGQSTRSFAEMGPPPRSTGILRMWRKDERGKQWSRGGGFRMSFRLLFCCLIIGLIIVISIILSIALYIRPPSVALNSVSLGSSPVTLTSDGLTLSFDLSISVANPNWFSADFKEISASLYYPGVDSSSLGGGTLYNVNFKGFTESTFDFPMTLNYTLSADTNKTILTDLESKCGITSSTTSDITVDYDLLLKVKILGLTISPTVSNSASFECPITASEIEGLIGGSS